MGSTYYESEVDWDRRLGGLELEIYVLDPHTKVVPFEKANSTTKQPGVHIGNGRAVNCELGHAGI